MSLKQHNMKHLLLLLFAAPLISFAQWTQVGSDIDGEAAGDKSGTAVGLSSDGTIVAIGAPQTFGSGNPGYVRVFENIAGVWTQIGSNIDGEAANDQFGNVLSLSGDGNIVAIGGYQNDGNGTDSGHVRVFENVMGVWTQIGGDLDGELGDDWSGFSVSLSGDGARVAIGALLNDGTTFSNVGHVRVYRRNGSNWIKVGTDLDGEASLDGFGWSVSLNGDGSVLAVGANSNDSNGADSGRAYVFEDIAGVWTTVGSFINGEAAGDTFGWSVSLNSIGNVLAVGGPNNAGNGAQSGHARVFENLMGVWTQIGTDIDGEVAGDRSGFRVSLSNDGSILAVGAPNNDFSVPLFNTGQVRVFQNIAGVWTQLGADIDGEAAGDGLGGSLGLSSDGTTLATGGPGSEGLIRVFNNASLKVITNSFGPHFKAHPNPSHGSTNIELGAFYQKVEVSMFDLLGKEMLHKTYNNTDKINLEIQQFSTGVYIVNVEAKTNKASLKLVVK